MKSLILYGDDAEIDVSQIRVTRLHDCRELFSEETAEALSARSLSPVAESREVFGHSVCLREIGTVFEIEWEQDEGNTLDQPVTALELSVRARNSLRALNIVTIRQLTETTVDQLSATKNFGVTTLNEVRRLLAERGLKLRDD